MTNIKHKIYARLAAMLYSVFESKSIYRSKDYRPELMFRCFEDRRSKVTDRGIFERIIRSYKSARAAQVSAGDVYQVNNEWAPIYKKHMGRVMAAMEAGDVGALMNIYNNFMRESCSVGLHGLSNNMAKAYFSGSVSARNTRIFLKECLYRHGVWDVTIGKTCGLEALKGPEIGNTYGYFIDGQFVEQGAHYHHYYATIISRLLRGAGHKTVMELGGGFGGMAYYLLRDNPGMTYVDFDLPENFALTAFYLLSAFPEKKIALYGEVDLAVADLAAYDAVLMPNFEISKLKTDSIDLVFNSYSLAEMSRETIETYLSVFNRVVRKFIYHVNHTRNSVVKADDFNVDLGKFELISRAPAVWNLARNPAMDEFEYIYKDKRLVFTVER